MGAPRWQGGGGGVLPRVDELACGQASLAGRQRCCRVFRSTRDIPASMLLPGCLLIARHRQHCNATSCWLLICLGLAKAQIAADHSWRMRQLRNPSSIYATYIRT